MDERALYFDSGLLWICCSNSSNISATVGLRGKVTNWRKGARRRLRPADAEGARIRTVPGYSSSLPPSHPRGGPSVCLAQPGASPVFLPHRRLPALFWSHARPPYVALLLIVCHEPTWRFSKQKHWSKWRQPEPLKGPSEGQYWPH